MLQEGVRPEVVRMEVLSFLLKPEELLSTYVTSLQERSALDLESGDGYLASIHALAVRHFQNFEFPLGAVIMTEETQDLWNIHYPHLTVQALNADRWVVHNNGWVEFVG